MMIVKQEVMLYKLFIFHIIYHIIYCCQKKTTQTKANVIENFSFLSS